MDYQQAKETGVIIAERNDCQLFYINGGDKHHYFMHSPKTGDHNVTTDQNICESTNAAGRVQAHWQGFYTNQ